MCFSFLYSGGGDGDADDDGDEGDDDVLMLEKRWRRSFNPFLFAFFVFTVFTTAREANRLTPTISGWSSVAFLLNARRSDFLLARMVARALRERD